MLSNTTCSLRGPSEDMSCAQTEVGVWGRGLGTQQLLEF